MRNKSRKRIMHELRLENERLRASLRGCREELFECKQMYDIREISGAVLVPNYVSDEERISEDHDIKIYDPKTQHINADLADRCNHGTR